MEIFCNRDILAGEDLCITYLEHSQMNFSVGYRRHVIKMGWGEECNCLLCTEESDPVNWKKFGLSEDLVDHTRAEEAVISWANNKFAPAICKYVNLSFEYFCKTIKLSQ
jgi:hypothetical protein